MKNLTKLTLASVSLWALAAPAMVQGAEADEDGVSDGMIIVTARRKDEEIQDVPMVVQAVTAQELDKLNIREFQAVQSLVPGLSLAQSANGIGAQATLRGVAFDVNASGNNGTIEFYLNDAPLSSGMLFQSMFDIGQIEVLRGPQGTLRGRASPSGSITVTTRRPDLTQPGAYLDGDINNIGGWNLRAAINVPVIEDKLAVRVAGVVDESDANEVRSVNSSARPSRKTRGIRASVQFNPVEILDLNFSYTANDRKVTVFDQVVSANIADPTLPASPLQINGRDRLSVMSSPRTYRQRFQVFNWQGELRLYGQKLNYVGAINKQKLDAFGRYDTGGFFLGYGAPTEFAGQTTHTRSRQTVHEIRLSNDERIAGIFDYVVGFLSNKSVVDVDLISETSIFFSFSPALPPPPAAPFLFLQTPIARDSANNERSFFGNITAHIGDRTEISGGIRRIRYQSESSLLIGGAAVGAAAEDRVLHATIYQATARHRFNDNIQAYAAFGTSWRPGSATNPIIFRNNTMPTPALSALYFPDPEKSKSFEIGIKTDWLDRRLRFNLTAYHQTFKNFAFSSRSLIFGGVDSGGNDAVFVASPAIAVGVPAKVDGVEAELQFQATPNWSLGIIASYAKSKLRNASVPCNDYNPIDGQPDSVSTLPTFAELSTATGGDLVQFCNSSVSAGTGSPFSTTVQTEYNRPLSNDIDGYLRGLMTYKGNSLNDPLNAVDDVKSYAVVNLYAGIRSPDRSWELGAYAKNVFNSQRALITDPRAETTSYRTLVGAFNGETTYRGVRYTNPREFGMTFRVAFGSR